MDKKNNKKNQPQKEIKGREEKQYDDQVVFSRRNSEIRKKDKKWQTNNYLQ